MKKLLFALLVNTVAMPAVAAEMPKAGDFIVRARAISVIPDEDAKISGAVTGSQIDIDTSVVPELDVSYFVTNNIAFELIAAITPHDVNTKTSSAGALDLGDVWLLPPTLTIQYHFTDLGQFKPYLGAGVNYTHFFAEDKGTSVTSVDYDDSFGPALQAGMDYMLDDHWMLNVDVKKIWINTDVKFNNGAIRADVDINPWVVGVGVGYKF
ncbi:MAG: OmpW family protein [Rickettsiales bacterium]|jgi:outer membrane protein|nr:OmpW family protein [Rickettsiales bacterium]